MVSVPTNGCSACTSGHILLPLNSNALEAQVGQSWVYTRLGDKKLPDLGLTAPHNLSGVSGPVRCPIDGELRKSCTFAYTAYTVGLIWITLCLNERWKLGHARY